MHIKQGKVAIVRIAATDRNAETIAVEVTMGDEPITITDDMAGRLSDEVRSLANQLIDQVILETKEQNNG